MASSAGPSGPVNPRLPSASTSSLPNSPAQTLRTAQRMGQEPAPHSIVQPRQPNGQQRQPPEPTQLQAATHAAGVVLDPLQRHLQEAYSLAISAVSNHLLRASELENTRHRELQQALAQSRNQVNQLNSALMNERRRAQAAEQEVLDLRQQLSDHKTTITQYQAQHDAVQRVHADRAELARGIERLVDVRLQDLLALGARFEHALLGYSDVVATLNAVRNEVFMLFKIGNLRHREARMGHALCPEPVEQEIFPKDEAALDAVLYKRINRYKQHFEALVETVRNPPPPPPKPEEKFANPNCPVGFTGLPRPAHRVKLNSGSSPTQLQPAEIWRDIPRPARIPTGQKDYIALAKAAQPLKMPLAINTSTAAVHRPSGYEHSVSSDAGPSSRSERAISPRNLPRERRNTTGATPSSTKEPARTVSASTVTRMIDLTTPSPKAEYPPDTPMVEDALPMATDVRTPAQNARPPNAATVDKLNDPAYAPMVSEIVVEMIQRVWLAGTKDGKDVRQCRLCMVDSDGEKGIYPGDAADRVLIDHCAEYHTLVWQTAIRGDIEDREEKLQQQAEAPTADMSDVEDGEVQ